MLDKVKSHFDLGEEGDSWILRLPLKRYHVRIVRCIVVLEDIIMIITEKTCICHSNHSALGVGVCPRCGLSVTQLL